MSLGGVLTDTAYLDASSTNIPASGGNSISLIAATSKEVASMLISSNVAVPFYLTLGPVGSEENWILIPGYASIVVTLDKFSITASKGVRIGARAFADAAATAGLVTINLWS